MVGSPSSSVAPSCLPTLSPSLGVSSAFRCDASGRLAYWAKAYSRASRSQLCASTGQKLVPRAEAPQLTGEQTLPEPHGVAGPVLGAGGKWGTRSLHRPPAPVEHDPAPACLSFFSAPQHMASTAPSSWPLQAASWPRRPHRRGSTPADLPQPFLPGGHHARTSAPQGDDSPPLHATVRASLIHQNHLSGSFCSCPLLQMEKMRHREVE